MNKHFISTIKSFFIIPLLVMTIAGCMPRGETRTLDEIYRDAKQQFLALNKGGLQAEVGSTVESLSAKLPSFAENLQGAQFKDASQELSDLLAKLSPYAGYTSRVSLAELSNQYRSFSDGADTAATQAKAKLLSARTMSLLSSELSTTRFGVK